MQCWYMFICLCLFLFVFFVFFFVCFFFYFGFFCLFAFLSFQCLSMGSSQTFRIKEERPLWTLQTTRFEAWWYFNDYCDTDWSPPEAQYPKWHVFVWMEAVGPLNYCFCFFPFSTLFLDLCSSPSCWDGSYRATEQLPLWGSGRTFGHRNFGLKVVIKFSYCIFFSILSLWMINSKSKYLLFVNLICSPFCLSLSERGHSIYEVTVLDPPLLFKKKMNTSAMILVRPLSRECVGSRHSSPVESQYQKKKKK